METGESKPQETAQLDVAKEKSQTSGQKLPLSDVGSLQSFVYGALIVIGIAFITLILQYFTATQASFDALKEQIIEQNNQIIQQGDKIDGLSQEICSFEQQRGFPCTTE
jgi:hypothetical protein